MSADRHPTDIGRSLKRAWRRGSARHSTPLDSTSDRPASKKRRRGQGRGVGKAERTKRRRGKGACGKACGIPAGNLRETCGKPAGNRLWSAQAARPVDGCCAGHVGTRGSVRSGDVHGACALRSYLRRRLGAGAVGAVARRAGQRLARIGACMSRPWSLARSLSMAPWRDLWPWRPPVVSNRKPALTALARASMGLPPWASAWAPPWVGHRPPPLPTGMRPDPRCRRCRLCAGKTRAMRPSRLRLFVPGYFLHAQSSSRAREGAMTGGAALLYEDKEPPSDGNPFASSSPPSHLPLPHFPVFIRLVWSPWVQSHSLL